MDGLDFGNVELPLLDASSDAMFTAMLISEIYRHGLERQYLPPPPARAVAAAEHEQAAPEAVRGDIVVGPAKARGNTRRKILADLTLFEAGFKEHLMSDRNPRKCKVVTANNTIVYLRLAVLIARGHTKKRGRTSPPVSASDLEALVHADKVTEHLKEKGHSCRRHFLGAILSALIYNQRHPESAVVAAHGRRCQALIDIYVESHQAAKLAASHSKQPSKQQAAQWVSWINLAEMVQGLQTQVELDIEARASGGSEISESELLTVLEFGVTCMSIKHMPARSRVCVSSSAVLSRSSNV